MIFDEPIEPDPILLLDDETAGLRDAGRAPILDRRRVFIAVAVRDDAREARDDLVAWGAPRPLDGLRRRFDEVPGGAGIFGQKLAAQDVTARGELAEEVVVGEELAKSAALEG